MTSFRSRLMVSAALAVILAAPVAAPQGNPVQPADKTTAKDKPVGAQGGPADGAGQGTKERDRVVIENADDYRYDPSTKLHYLRGNVIFTTKDVRLTCDAADYNEEADTMKASGNLRASDPSSVMTGDLLDADFGRELMIITGNVHVISQKKPDSQKRKSEAGPEMSVGKGRPKSAQLTPDGRNKPPGSTEANAPATRPGRGKPVSSKEARFRKTVMTCERAEYFYADDQKRMVATPRVKAVQEEHTVFADQAVYEDIPRTVTLTGNVLVQSRNGDEMRCEKAIIGVDDEWIKAEKVKGTTLRKRKGEGAKPASPAPSPVAPGPAPAPVAPSPAPAPAAKPEG